MPDNVPPASTNDKPDGKVKKPRRPRADYDQKLANDLAAAKTLITSALKDPAVLAKLSYKASELNKGLALQVAAQAAFNNRQKKVGEEAAMQKTRDELLKTVKAKYIDLRTAVTTSELPESAYTPLGATGRVPVDLQKLVTVLRGVYAAAQSPEYLTLLETRNYSAASLAADLQEAEDLEKAHGAFQEAERETKVATALRDKAGKTLRTWIGKFRKQAKRDAKKHPEVLAKLAL